MSLASRPPRFAALALDFDGVLFDSVPECLRLSYAVFRSLDEQGAVDPASVLRAQPSVSDRELFLERRGLVRPAGHYYLLWKWLREFPERQLSPSQFEALEAEHGEAVQAFSDRFFGWRTALREQHPETWLEWNRPFPGVVEQWPRLRKMPRYIVTTKDRGAVGHLLDAYGLDVTGMFAMGEFGAKGEALRAIADAVAVTPHRVLFVDDNASHLRDGLAAGATVRWAAWGYDPSGRVVAPALKDIAELVDLVESAV